jgi:hypothetical protein
MCDFNPRKSRFKVSAVIYRSIFITQAPVGQHSNLYLNDVLREGGGGAQKLTKGDLKVVLAEYPL